VRETIRAAIEAISLASVFMTTLNHYAPRAVNHSIGGNGIDATAPIYCAGWVG